jgi:hypothetical protein
MDVSFRLFRRSLKAEFDGASSVKWSMEVKRWVRLEEPFT